MVTPEGSARDFIIALASAHGLKPERDLYDDLADDFSRLAGDEGELDDVELLLVEIEKAGLVTGVDVTLLHDRYLTERSDGV